MTPAEQARWFIQHPVALGHAVGFTKLKEYPHGEWLNWMINGKEDGTLQAHRGSYKTSCLILAIPLLMVKKPMENIIFLRKTDTDVSEVIEAVDKILRHPVFRQIFKALTDSDLQVIRSNSTEITTNIYDAPKGGSQLLGIGIGGSLTGKHAWTVITDDIVNLKDRISRAERERTKSIYQELQNIKNRGGRIFNTGTPWHKEDAFCLMPEPKRYDWQTTKMLTPEQVESLRASMAPSLFAANYELVHIAAEDVLFKTAPVFITTERAAEVLKRPDATPEDLLRDGTAHIDAAYGGEDYTAFTCGKKIGDKIYMYGRLWQGHVDRVLDFCISETRRLMCGSIWCEKNADKGYLAQEITDAGQPAAPYTEKENKYVKISTFLRKWWDRIEWLEGTDTEYINQILSYTEDAEHDDAPDSAACVCRIFDRQAGEEYQSPFSRQRRII